MKKIIALVLAVAVIAVGGWLLYSQVLTNPERLIIGDWACDGDAGIDGIANFEGYEFKVEGKVIVKGTLIADLQYEGTYAIDKENGTITITYEILGYTYNDVSKFAFDDGTLTLTDTDSNLVTTFTKLEK